MKRVVTRADYTVANSEIFLTIKIGDAQIGGSAVSVKGDIIATGDILNLRLGRGAELRGTQVRAKTTVADINDMTNNTSVTYTLEGGPTPMNLVIESNVDADGDSMVFSARIDLL